MHNVHVHIHYSAGVDEPAERSFLPRGISSLTLSVLMSSVITIVHVSVHVHCYGSISNCEAAREHVILHSVNVKQQSSNMADSILVYSLYGIKVTLRKHKPNYFGHEAPPSTIWKKQGSQDCVSRG